MAYSVVEAPYVFEYRKAMEEEGKKGPRRVRGIALFCRNTVRIEMRGNVCQARVRLD
jgi:hypothetical protein